MGDKLAQLLYESFRSASADPGALLSWGNIPSTERETWEAVATRARGEMARRFVACIDHVNTEFPDAKEAALSSLRRRWA